MVIDPLTPFQGHQFDHRLKLFSVSGSTAHPQVCGNSKIFYLSKDK